jgi:hypothetical protein
MGSSQKEICTECEVTNLENKELKTELSFLQGHREEVQELLNIKEILDGELAMQTCRLQEEQAQHEVLAREQVVNRAVSLEFEELLLEILKSKMPRKINEIALAAARLSTAPSSIQKCFEDLVIRRNSRAY